MLGTTGSRGVGVGDYLLFDLLEMAFSRGLDLGPHLLARIYVKQGG